jgi:hypothetical protein
MLGGIQLKGDSGRRPIDIPGGVFEQSYSQTVGHRADEKGFPPGKSRLLCWPGGVPAIDSYEFIQTPKQALIITEHDQQVRRIHLNVPHAERPTWYGKSLGCNEGDMAVHQDLWNTVSIAVLSDAG